MEGTGQAKVQGSGGLWCGWRGQCVYVLEEEEEAGETGTRGAQMPVEELGL